MILEDEGIPYNPLEQDEVDIDIPVEQKEIGGLGILMAKNMSNKIKYKREDNKNIIEIIFDIP